MGWGKEGPSCFWGVGKGAKREWSFACSSHGGSWELLLSHANCPGNLLGVTLSGVLGAQASLEGDLHSWKKDQGVRPPTLGQF